MPQWIPAPCLPSYRSEMPCVSRRKPCNCLATLCWLHHGMSNDKLLLLLQAIIKMGLSTQQVASFGTSLAIPRIAEERLNFPYAFNSMAMLASGSSDKSATFEQVCQQLDKFVIKTNFRDCKSRAGNLHHNGGTAVSQTLSCTLSRTTSFSRMLTQYQPSNS